MNILKKGKNIPFSIAAYNNTPNCTVVTEEGFTVRILATDMRCDEKIVALVDNGVNEELVTYDSDGFGRFNHFSPISIMIPDTPKKGDICVFWDSPQLFIISRLGRIDDLDDGRYEYIDDNMGDTWTYCVKCDEVDMDALLKYMDNAQTMSESDQDY